MPLPPFPQPPEKRSPATGSEPGDRTFVRSARPAAVGTSKPPAGRADGLYQPEELTVRFRRRRGFHVSSAHVWGSGLSAGVVSLLAPDLGLLGAMVVSIVFASVPPVLAAATARHEWGRYFAYDRLTHTIRAWDKSWGRWRHYPRNPGSSLRYRGSTGELLECRPDGPPVVLPIKQKRADPEDWKAFMVHFRRDHPPPPAPLPLGPPLPAARATPPHTAP